VGRLTSEKNGETIITCNLIVQLPSQIVRKMERTDNYCGMISINYVKTIIEAEEMFYTPENSNTTVTFTILVMAIASLFASSSILENQQAFAANGAGSGGAGSAGGSSHAASGGGSGYSGTGGSGGGHYHAHYGGYGHVGHHHHHGY
jgi:hypothetical protein